MTTPDERGVGERVPVVAAVIRRGDDVLLALRPTGKRHAGRWEFPGGKVAAGESMADAISRELLEELALQVVLVGETLFTAIDPGSRFEIHFVSADVQGVPKPLEHEELRWVGPTELRALPLAPADARFVSDALENQR